MALPLAAVSVAGGAAAAMASGHFAHAGDLCARVLLKDATKEGGGGGRGGGGGGRSSGGGGDVRFELLWRLAAAKRSGGHLRAALLAARRAQDEAPAGCGCEAHFEEGAAWQALDCTAYAAQCFRRALASDPSHGPSADGAAFCAAAEASGETKSGGRAEREQRGRPGAEPTYLLGAAARGCGVVAQHGALPEALAEQVFATLAAAPAETCWRLNQRGNSGSAAASANSGVQAANMSYHMYVGPDLDAAVPGLRPQLAAALAMLPHERLLMNASKYVEGSFLDAHTDAPSGSGSHERVRAFVWHLSKEVFAEADGGVFVDEESQERFVPRWNTLVHFEVPRWHSVSLMATAKARVAIYGWVVVPKVHLVPSEVALQRTLYQHRIVAMFYPGASGQEEAANATDSDDAGADAGESRMQHLLLDVFGAAAHRPAPGGGTHGACTRGDYIHCCVATAPWATPNGQEGEADSTELTESAAHLIHADVVAAQLPAVLMFVDNAQVGRVQPRNLDGTAAAVEGLFDTAWSCLRGMMPVLRNRDAWEDQLCLAAMRFNTKPLLALVVGRSARHQRMDPAVMHTVRAVADALGGMGGPVFVYATTNPRLCVRLRPALVSIILLF